MIPFARRVLPNGLVVLSHYDGLSSLASVVVLYRVGASHEKAGKTGLAHLCEHLMFSGSRHAPDFDNRLQQAGGSNNAYTNQDTTLYYCDIPGGNLETALWLESDRMGWLDISERSFEVQRSVVIEEFKQSYLNQPYGDMHHLQLGLAYRNNSYRWPTIGVSPEEIAAFTREDVEHFYRQYYNPSNAILCVAGNVEEERVFELANKWFADLPFEVVPPLEFNPEWQLLERRDLEVRRAVPQDALLWLFPMPGAGHEDYGVYDTISDLLSHGDSSRFQLRLVSERALFSDLSAYVSGTHRDGLFQIEGYLSEGVSYQEAEEAIWGELRALRQELTEYELEKVHNKYRADLLYRELSVSGRAQTLALYEQLGGAELANSRMDRRLMVTRERVLSTLDLMIARGCHRLRYMAEA